MSHHPRFWVREPACLVACVGHPAIRFCLVDVTGAGRLAILAQAQTL